MRIKGYDIYGLEDQSFLRDTVRIDQERSGDNRAVIDQDTVRSFQERLDRSKDLISTSEKQFFKELFPESTQQIDSHIVFNRSGKIQSSNVRKGVILDTVV